MKRRVVPRDAAELEREFPIAGRLDGWFFRVRETSAGAWAAEGSDLHGRLVSRQGGDPDELLEACIDDARAIAAQVG